MHKRGARRAGEQVAMVEGSGTGAEAAADRLALALEEVGFDVGRAFPGLGAVPGRAGAPVVVLGSVAVAVADALAVVLVDAARAGITAPGGGGPPVAP